MPFISCCRRNGRIVQTLKDKGMWEHSLVAMTLNCVLLMRWRRCPPLMTISNRYHLCMAQEDRQDRADLEGQGMWEDALVVVILYYMGDPILAR